MLGPLTVVELDAAIAGFRGDGAALDELHQALMRATPLSPDPPMRTLATAGAVVAAATPEQIDGLPPRPRTAFRLLRHGALGAAWAVVTDNATGIVDEPFGASTATGAPRTAWRLPLLTRVEAPLVFADLPGFRDPRYDAPDACYDITAGVLMLHGLDEICIGGTSVVFGGWAALGSLVAGPDERVRVIASNGIDEISVAARRLRRPDRGSDAQRVWSGWSACVPLDDPQLVAGSWALSLELDHGGISRRAPIGSAVGRLARAATRGQTQVGARTLRWETEQVPWLLVVN